MEKHYWKIFLFIGIISLASCGTSKNSTSNNYAHENRSSQPQFIDGIEILPGKSYKTVKNPNSKLGDKEGVSKYTKNLYNNFGTENANAIQIKYAVILNTALEDIAVDVPLLSAVDHWWGTPYMLGGNTESGIDCSGFSKIILYDIYNQDIPRTAQEQYTQSEVLSDGEQLHEGDLVFFGSSKRSISHVGVYITNNKFAHASTSKGVMISDLNENYWARRYRGSGRYLHSDKTTLSKN